MYKYIIYIRNIEMYNGETRVYNFECIDSSRCTQNTYTVIDGRVPGLMSPLFLIINLLFLEYSIVTTADILKTFVYVICNNILN